MPDVKRRLTSPTELFAKMTALLTFPMPEHKERGRTEMRPFDFLRSGCGAYSAG
ncbi:MAG: hypothetical protein J0I29_00545 [Rhizobiales bacterium]|nr:hypothetical protein [Hyphomicrobiales bacterium]